MLFDLEEDPEQRVDLVYIFFFFFVDDGVLGVILISHQFYSEIEEKNA